MGEPRKKAFWAACIKCSWLQTYDTRSDAADAQTEHDARHKPWVLNDKDREFLRVNRIAASEDEEDV